MANQLFRCLCCTNPETGRPPEFEAQRGVCPACKADGDGVQKLETIHFDPPSGRPNRGLRKAACDPKITINSSGQVRMTGEPVAVTCKACKATPVYRLEAEVRGVPVVPEDCDRVIEAEAAK